MVKYKTITIENTEIVLLRQNEKDYISLTDMAAFDKKTEPRFVIFNWMSTFATLDYLATWEEYYNPDFNRVGFQTVRYPSGRLLVSPKKWIEATNAIGIISKSGRYGGGTRQSSGYFWTASSLHSSQRRLMCHSRVGGNPDRLCDERVSATRQSRYWHFSLFSQYAKIGYSVSKDML